MPLVATSAAVTPAASRLLLARPAPRLCQSQLQLKLATFSHGSFPRTSASLLYRRRSFQTSTNRHIMASDGNANGTAPSLRFKNPAILICDMQDKFKTAIHEFDKIVLTTQKLLNFANGLSIPVLTTTQTSAKLGDTVPSLAALLPSPPVDKTRFSMAVPGITSALPPAPSAIALVGIESHICITQTALDLRDAGYRVYVLADGVSSCNRGEVLVALDRLRAEQGVTVTTSESWMYECMGDASHADFKKLIGVVKTASADTKQVVEALPPTPKM